jgi:hypothetical protein
MRPRFTAPAGYPALLDWSGGCGTRATRSDSPRRHPLTSLRYSAAHRGKKAKRFCVRCAHDLFCGDKSGFARHRGQSPPVFLVLLFHPLSAASIGRERAVGLGEHCLSTWPRSGSCELRSPARWCPIEGTPAGGGKPGRRFLDYFLWPHKESDWRAGPHPATLFCLWTFMFRHSHSTTLSKYDSQVAGYQHQRC